MSNSDSPADAPMVFLSHASDDKERFVLPFARALEGVGVRVWVDRCQMLPGDSIVDKIFEEGIGSADAVIVVISANSMSKPWVREEMNAAFVKRLEKGTKLIPIVLDGCEVPEALKATVWEPVSDTQNLDASVRRVADAVFGQRRNPELGSPPRYATSPVEVIQGLSTVDSIILTFACQRVMERNHPQIQVAALEELMNAEQIARDTFEDSLEILHRRGYIDLLRGFGSRLADFMVLFEGFEKYARQAIPGYSALITDVGYAVVNGDFGDSRKYAERREAPLYLVNHALGFLTRLDLVGTAHCGKGTFEVLRVSPELRRRLENE